MEGVSMNDFVRFNRWVNKLSPRRGLVCHFYMQEKDKKYHGKIDFAYFNLVSNSRDWVIKGTKEHGISNNHRKSQIPCLNCFDVNEKFENALRDLGEKENFIFELGVIFNKRKLKNDFKKVIDVSTKWPDPFPLPNKCHYYDDPRFRKGPLQPFHFCDVVRIETKRNRYCNDIDGIDIVRGDAILAMLVKQEKQEEILELLRIKGLNQVKTFAVL
jgi:hypothetical protein